MENINDYLNVQLAQAIEDYLEPYKNDVSKQEKVKKAREILYELFKLSPNYKIEPMSIELKLLIGESKIEIEEFQQHLFKIRKQIFKEDLNRGIQIDPKTIIYDDNFLKIT